MNNRSIASFTESESSKAAMRCDELEMSVMFVSFWRAGMARAGRDPRPRVPLFRRVDRQAPGSRRLRAHSPTSGRDDACDEHLCVCPRSADLLVAFAITE